MNDSGTPVAEIIGTGLLGTSIGLALRAQGVQVRLFDPSPTALALAHDVGAGVPRTLGVDRGDDVTLVVVAAPPDVTAKVVAQALLEHPQATVTDVASVKAGVLAELGALGADLSRYVGGHPMAGRERSGPVAAQTDLFLGRPWVVCPHALCDPARVEQVRRLVLAVGATPVEMGPQEHDDAVALVSHVPQVAASLVAGLLRDAPIDAVGLAGQGLRDVTRIAASDPTLWAQILSANAAPVGALLREMRADLDGVIEALGALDTDSTSAPGARATVARLVGHGNEGRERIPGKHGSARARYAVVTALVPDRAGELARLLSDIGEEGINLEELNLEHSPGQPVGMADVSVMPAVRERLVTALRARGWHVVA